MEPMFHGRAASVDDGGRRHVALRVLLPSGGSGTCEERGSVSVFVLSCVLEESEAGDGNKGASSRPERLSFDSLLSRFPLFPSEKSPPSDPLDFH